MPYCNVYLIEYKQSPRTHPVIFVEVTTDGSGQGYNVVGSAADGMSYETKFMTKPENDAGFASRTVVGVVDAGDIDTFGQVCESVRTPTKQWAQGKKIDPQAKEIDGHDWTRDAIIALRDAGILRSL